VLLGRRFYEERTNRAAIKYVIKYKIASFARYFFGQVKRQIKDECFHIGGNDRGIASHLERYSIDRLATGTSRAEQRECKPLSPLSFTTVSAKQVCENGVYF